MCHEARPHGIKHDIATEGLTHIVDGCGDPAPRGQKNPLGDSSPGKAGAKGNVANIVYRRLREGREGPAHRGAITHHPLREALRSGNNQDPPARYSMLPRPHQ
jgi:hypothetical protein